MSYSQRMEKAKPYITGFVLGIVAAPIVAFSAGWVSTSGARAAAVETARVDTYAGICTANAARIAALQSTDLATLRGFANRAQREELVAMAMAEFTVPDDLSARVTTGCNRTLA